MPPSSSLQGLNLIHPVHDSSPVDSRNLLLGQPYPDLTAQLDLWSSLNFESDDPLAPENKNSLPDDEDDEARSPVSEEKAILDGHANVVTPTNLNPPVPVVAAATAQPFDLNALLATFGLDSFSPTATPLHPQPQVIAPSLAQILALHSVGYPPGLLPFPIPPINPSSAALPNPPSDQSHASAKRPRTRRSSVTIDEHEDGSPSPAPGSPIPVSSTSSPSGLTPLSATEDKRRRNTAASARFRLKKKEREAALEGKAKDLESKVVDLERECEALRRENGWLKGLVVGVTGAATQPPPAPVSTGTKRSREEPGSL